ncbi:MAG: helix-turn-helix domain-containing protein [Deltaproteobacteria bacterium]
MDIGFENSSTELSTELRPAERLAKHFRHEGELRELAAAHDYNARRIARHLGISGRQLQRIFKARLNCSPALWLREQRLLRARQMLYTSSSVKRVAYSLGFSQVSQFCRDFKARFGHRPSADLPRSQPQAGGCAPKPLG